MAKKRAHVVVEGVVQGVGYRYFVMKQGRALGLSGFVQNLPDGSVEAVIEGDENDIAVMIREMKNGPFMARVDNLHLDWGEFTGKFLGFSVQFPEIIDA